MEKVAKYIYKIYEKRSFSLAAKDLYISQPALSTAISKFEQEMGFMIFDRTKNPIALTNEGQIYIETIRQIMECEDSMKQRIRQLSNETDPIIKIGCYSSATHYIGSLIFGKFHMKHPNVKFNIAITNIGSLINAYATTNENVDLFLSYDFDGNDYIGVPIFDEQVIIAMHRDLPGADRIAGFAVTKDELLSKSYPKEKKITDLSIFSSIPFIEYSPNAHTRKIMDKLIPNYLTAKTVVLRSRTVDINYHYMCEKAGALVLGDTMIKNHSHDDCDLLYFVPAASASRRTLHIAYRKDHALSVMEKEYIETARELFSAK